MISSINSSFVVPQGAITPVALEITNALIDTAAISDLNDSAAPASIVNLSAEAQLLSTSNSIATAASQSNGLIADQENFVHLSAAVRAQLNREINTIQSAALITSEFTAIDAALQIALADAALSEAVAATAAPLATATSDAIDMVANPVADAPTSVEAIVTDELLNDELVNTPPSAPVSTDQEALPAAVDGNGANVIPENGMPAIPLPPDISSADPAVAAAIAAYQLGEGFSTAPLNHTDEIPPESDIDVAAVSAVEASMLDLHDGARDDAANGIAWNWMRVNPVQQKFTKR
jgi:hypothetical protein